MLTSEGFMLLDREYRITEVNDAIFKMSGFSREETIGKSPLQFSPEGYTEPSFSIGRA